MTRMPISKKLVNTHLANEYGGWIYCENCHKTIGYLCYVTYDRFELAYQCKCGGSGRIQIAFTEEIPDVNRESALVSIKNRLCCPTDESPLFSLNKKRLHSYKYAVLCKACKTVFKEEGQLD